jgi:hypothetical protein
MNARRISRSRPPIACVGLVALAAAACSSPTPSQPPTSTSAAPTSHAAQTGGLPPSLWGDFKPVVSVKELMKYMIDPVADNIFNAVGMTVTKQGVVEREPKTEEDWNRIQSGAVSLAEGAYLLKVRRPFAPPGDENNSKGPDAVELAPAAITAKVERDLVEWNARIEAMRNVALQVMDIVKRKDVNELWDAGENLEGVCEACHRSYWYPGESAEFYQKLRRRAEEFSERQSERGATHAAPKK